MSDLLTPGPHHRESEFVFDSTQRRWLTGTCGPCALAMAAWNATGKETHTLDVYRLMHAHGLCDINGASTPDAIWHAANELLGLTTTEYHGYAGDNWPGWRAFLARHAGKDAVVLELAHGQNLHDEISGKGENAVGLRYHYICWYGASGDGGLFADGDNYAVGDVLQRYSFATLANAVPCAAIAIHVPTEAQMAWTKQPDGTGKDGAGHECGDGDINYIIGNGLAGVDGLMNETPYAGPDTFLPLANGRIVTAKHNDDGTWTIGEAGAQALVDVWGQLQAAKSAPPANPADHEKAQALDNLMALYGVK